MPYDPNYIDAEKAVRNHRERLYWLTLLSGAENIAVLWLHLNGVDSLFYGVLLGGMVGALLLAGIQGRTDEYYKELQLSGMRFMAFGLGATLFLLWGNAETDLVARVIPAIAQLANDAFLLALLLALLFHAGFAVSYLRDRLAAGGDE